jgi:hypothetical protein
MRAPGFADYFDAILASKDYNIRTYELGVGRQLTEHWSGAVQALYEPSINKTFGPLDPTEGAFGLGVGAATPRTAASSSPAAPPWASASRSQCRSDGDHPTQPWRHE